MTTGSSGRAGVGFALTAITTVLLCVSCLNWMVPSHVMGTIYVDNQSANTYAAQRISPGGEVGWSSIAVEPHSSDRVVLDEVGSDLSIGFFDAQCTEVYRTPHEAGSWTVEISPDGTFQRRSGSVRISATDDAMRGACIEVFAGIWASSSHWYPTVVRLADLIPEAPGYPRHQDFRLPGQSSGWVSGIEELRSRLVEVLDQKCELVASVQMPDGVSGVVIDEDGSVTVVTGNPQFDYESLLPAWPGQGGCLAPRSTDPT